MDRNDDFLRDRHMERTGLTWKVFMNKKLICDGFKTRQQAHDFIKDEIKPMMQNEQSIINIDKMNKYNTIIAIIDDNQTVRIVIGLPNMSLPDFNGI